jgi:hypothetical protein
MASDSVPLVPKDKADRAAISASTGGPAPALIAQRQSMRKTTETVRRDIIQTSINQKSHKQEQYKAISVIVNL